MKIQRIKALPEQPIIRRAAIYCRVSTSKQDQVMSLASQIGNLVQEVTRNRTLVLYDVYVDVCSGTGKYERKSMERLKADCQAGNVDYVITKSVSRFYRDTEYLLRTVRELREVGVEVYFQNENVSSFDKDSELLLALTGAIAQAESENKSLNIKWGISRAKENPDSKMNKRKFYGYKHDEKGDLIIDPEQAEVVKKIYALYIEGNSVLRIISILAENKTPTARGKEKWSKHGIEVILSDERYTGVKTIKSGINYYKIIKDNHPAIINPSTFAAVQDIKKMRSNVVQTEDGEVIRNKKRYTSPKKLNEGKK